MSDAPESQSGDDSQAPAEVVGDALRTAVERTLAATAGSATGTRQRAQGLLDDVVRRGQVAREQVTRRGEEASSRLAEAINELRTADRATIDDHAQRIAGLERRLAYVESRLIPQSDPLVEVESSTVDPRDQRESEG